MSSPKIQEMSPDTTERRYHHGDLPAALRAATVELVAERGPTGFSLREVARRAGVSHAAPAHHFGDSEGLLTAVSTEGFETLCAAFADAVEGVENARERLRRLGQAYVRTAIDHPGHYGVMVTDSLTDDDDPAHVAAGSRAYEYLSSTVEMIRDQMNPELDVDAAATLCWSAMHGLVGLSPKLDHVAETTGTGTSPLIDLVDRFTAMMIDGMSAR